MRAHSTPLFFPPSLCLLTRESMASKASSLLSAVLLLISYSAVNVDANVDPGSLHLIADAIEWPGSAASYSYSLETNPDEVLTGDSDESGIQRRSLFWLRRHLAYYYISYGALSANRVPCPPRSGRSYYTHNCYHARGPVHPYTRGCNAITLCRR